MAQGYITSDSDSCADIFHSHHMAPDAVHAAADCLEGGTQQPSSAIEGCSAHGTHLAELLTARLAEPCGEQLSVLLRCGIESRFARGSPGLWERAVGFLGRQVYSACACTAHMPRHLVRLAWRAIARHGLSGAPDTKRHEIRGIVFGVFYLIFVPG